MQDTLQSILEGQRDLTRRFNCLEGQLQCVTELSDKLKDVVSMYDDCRHRLETLEEKVESLLSGRTTAVGDTASATVAPAGHGYGCERVRERELTSCSDWQDVVRKISRDEAQREARKDNVNCAWP